VGPARGSPPERLPPSAMTTGTDTTTYRPSSQLERPAGHRRGSGALQGEPVGDGGRQPHHEEHGEWEDGQNPSPIAARAASRWRGRQDPGFGWSGRRARGQATGNVVPPGRRRSGHLREGWPGSMSGWSGAAARGPRAVRPGQVRHQWIMRAGGAWRGRQNARRRVFPKSVCHPASDGCWRPRPGHLVTASPGSPSGACRSRRRSIATKPKLIKPSTSRKHEPILSWKCRRC